MDEKYILKRSFKNVLPDSITNRPKHPYRAPISESLLNHEAADYTLDMLSEKALEESGLFNAAKVGKLVKLLQGPRAGSEVNNMALVGILSTQLVHKRFIDDFPKEPPVSVPPDLVFDRRNAASN